MARLLKSFASRTPPPPPPLPLIPHSSPHPKSKYCVKNKKKVKPTNRVGPGCSRLSGSINYVRNLVYWVRTAFKLSKRPRELSGHVHSFRGAIADRRSENGERVSTADYACNLWV